MGFFDSIKGFAAGAVDLLSSGFQAIAPSFLEAGAGALFSSIFPGQQPAGSQVFRRPALGPVQAPRIPPTATFQPFGSFVDAPIPVPRGLIAMPHAPTDKFGVTTAGGPFVTQAEFDLPFIDLQSPVVRDARSGGNAFFRGAGVVGNRPRSLIIVPNPTTGAPTFFKHAGRPILFSGDFRAAKLVHKLARRARRASPRR